MTLTDVAFGACTALAHSGETAVLCGGSAATYYVPEQYQSVDIDFVLHTETPRHVVDRALATLGYTRAPEGYYVNAALLYTIEFPVGPLAIGREEVRAWRTERREDALLHVLTPFDVVRDRFLHYWAWGDETALIAAWAVARERAADVDLEEFRAWTEREREADRSYDHAGVDRFFAGLAA